LHLRAENKAGRTIETYLDALRLAAQFLTARGVELEEARREDIEAYRRPARPLEAATAANRYRSLRVFYGWLEAEAEIPTTAPVGERVGPDARAAACRAGVGHRRLLPHALLR
jgi:site-specific recombinase XerD